MKLIHASQGELAFALRRQERTLLLQVLRLYPQVPEDCGRVTEISRDPKLKETRRLLREALRAERAANRQRLRDWLKAPGRFEPADATSNGFVFHLPKADVDWLLQVLNDVRVGCWVQLGSPDPNESPTFKITAENIRRFSAMEISGFFQMRLLEALEAP